MPGTERGPEYRTSELESTKSQSRCRETADHTRGRGPAVRDQAGPVGEANPIEDRVAVASGIQGFGDKSIHQF